MIFRKFLPHLLMVLSVMMLTLFVIDSINNAMGFLRGDVFRGLLLVYIIVAMLSSAMLMIFNARKK